MAVGWSTLTVRTRVFDRMKKIFESAITTKKVTPFLSDFIEDIMDKEDVVKSSFPDFESLGNRDGILYIKNKSTKEIAEITSDGAGQLKSSIDDPLFLQYAWAISDISLHKDKL